ncbi:MAG TPA: glycosyltransferase [Chlamydiales bacterium]|nr:glycosyltransferase [Chlamydiales bacterium]
MLRVLVLFFSFSLVAKETICLNMIVKNESPVIRRCLESIRPYIDYWVIVDTGSTDGTQKIIKNYLKDIPGELYERPWKNFGFNRSEAFLFAQHKGDYILFIDADDTLQIEDQQCFSNLIEDLYTMWRGFVGFSSIHPQLVKGDLPWKFVGVTHEYLACDVPYTSAFLEGVKYVTGSGGHRSCGKEKFFANIRLLEDGIKQEPDNARYYFYLAESYRDAGEKGKALEWYQKRVAMGGWSEEVYWSMLQIGHCLRDLGLPKNVVTDSYLNALMFRPSRIETFFYLAQLNNDSGDYQSAYTFLQMRDANLKSNDALFNLDWIGDYGLTFLRSICSYYVGNYQESLDACEELLNNPRLPESWREQTLKNKQFPLDKLKQ